MCVKIILNQFRRYAVEMRSAIVLAIALLIKIVFAVAQFFYILLINLLMAAN